MSAHSTKRGFKASFTGVVRRFAIATTPSDKDKPAAMIEAEGALIIADAPHPYSVRQAMMLKIDKSRKSKARFSFHFVEGDTTGLMELPSDEFDFLVHALRVKPQGRVEVNAAVELDLAHRAEGSRIDADHFDISIF